MFENMWLHYLILLALYLVYNLPQFIDKYSTNEPELNPCSILVLVISARSNYDNRQAIRKTWMQAVKGAKNMCFAFVIGKECTIPPGDRLDQYGCQEWLDHTNDLNPHGQFISNSFHEQDFPSQLPVGDSNWYTGVGFKILHPVTLTTVGVHVKVVPTHGSVNVMLRDATSKVFSIEISRQSCSSIEKGFCFQHLEQDIFQLPKYYEAEIILPNKPNEMDFHAPYVDCQWVNASVIQYTFGRINNVVQPFDQNKCSLVAFIFEVDDVDSLQGHFQTRSFRSQRQELFLNESNSAFTKEMIENRDIAFLPDFIDVYRNLPLKLLKSLIWANSRYSFDFILKVDDDSYVNVRRLRDLVSGLPADGPPMLLGGFLHHASTNLFGKWAEVEYSSMEYPSFPTGAGYILTKNLVTLLVEASPYLKSFQGEDVSLAIWTEGLTGTSKNPDWTRVRKVEVKCWISVPKCPNFFVKQQLTSQMMYKLHFKI